MLFLFLLASTFCPKLYDCLIAVASWFLSPLLSGIMSAIVFYLIRMFILHKVNCLSDWLLQIVYAT